MYLEQLEANPPLNCLRDIICVVMRFRFKKNIIYEVTQTCIGGLGLRMRRGREREFMKGREQKKQQNSGSGEKRLGSPSSKIKG